MSTIFYADPPVGERSFLPISVTPWAGTADSIFSRQTLSDGAGRIATNDLYYIGSFNYPDPGKLDGVTGTVTEVKVVYNEELVTFSWTGFTSSLEAIDRAEMTVGGWDDFYRNVLLPGDDLISSSRSVSEGLNGYDGNDTITSGSGSDHLRGDAGNDSIVGGAGFDDAHGNAGNDTVSGGQGDDWVVGGKDQDLLWGDDGSDIVYGNLGDDTLDGGAGADIVRGGQANDVVRGGAGADYVSGDMGDDTVTGGFGADLFHTWGGAGFDRVTDFNLAEGDRVMLDPGTIYTTAQVGADVVITMDGGAQMTLVGVQLSSLDGGWIVA
jgi:serralysin